MSFCGRAVFDLRLCRCHDRVALTARMPAKSTKSAKSTAKRPFWALAYPRGRRRIRHQRTTSVSSYLSEVSARGASQLLVIARHKQADPDQLDQTLALLHRIVCMHHQDACLYQRPPAYLTAVSLPLPLPLPLPVFRKASATLRGGLSLELVTLEQIVKGASANA
jgi:hypothetical protein